MDHRTDQERAKKTLRDLDIRLLEMVEGPGRSEGDMDTGSVSPLNIVSRLMDIVKDEQHRDLLQNRKVSWCRFLDMQIRHLVFCFLAYESSIILSHRWQLSNWKRRNAR